MKNGKRNLVAPALAASLALALSLSACGIRQPANPPVDTSGSSSVASSVPNVSPTTAPMPNYPTTNPGVVPANPMTGSLVVSNLVKKKTGFIFKKLVVTCQVMNTSSAPLSGMLNVQFKKSHGIFNKTLVNDATQTQAVTPLQPGQSLSLTVTSTGDEDDAEVTVSTYQQYPSANAYGAGASTGAYGGTGSYGGTGAYGGTGSYGGTGAYGGATTGGTYGSASYPGGAPTTGSPYGY